MKTEIKAHYVNVFYVKRGGVFLESNRKNALNTIEKSICDHNCAL